MSSSPHDAIRLADVRDTPLPEDQHGTGAWPSPPNSVYTGAGSEPPISRGSTPAGSLTKTPRRKPPPPPVENTAPQKPLPPSPPSRANSSLRRQTSSVTSPYATLARPLQQNGDIHRSFATPGGTLQKSLQRREPLGPGPYPKPPLTSALSEDDILEAVSEVTWRRVGSTRNTAAVLSAFIFICALTTNIFRRVLLQSLFYLNNACAVLLMLALLYLAYICRQHKQGQNPSKDDRSGGVGLRAAALILGALSAIGTAIGALRQPGHNLATIVVHILGLHIILAHSKICLTNRRWLASFVLGIATQGSLYLGADEALDDMLATNSVNTTCSLECSVESVLRPATAQFMLVMAAFFAAMFTNVSRPRPRGARRSFGLEQRSRLVTCRQTSTGLVVGVVVLSACTAAALFLASPQADKWRFIVYHVVQGVVLLSMVLVIFMAIVAMKYRHSKPRPHTRLSRPLLLLSLLALYVYCILSVVAGVLSYVHSPGDSPFVVVTTIISYSLQLVEATLQVIFLLDALRRFNNRHENKSRRLIVYLLVGNLALWFLAWFEMSSSGQALVNPLQTKFYSHPQWTVVWRAAAPFAIFFRLHSSVCLFDVWQFSYD